MHPYDVKVHSEIIHSIHIFASVVPNIKNSQISSFRNQINLCGRVGDYCKFINWFTYS